MKHQSWIRWVRSVRCAWSSNRAHQAKLCINYYADNWNKDMPITRQAWRPRRSGPAQTVKMKMEAYANNKQIKKNKRVNPGRDRRRVDNDNNRTAHTTTLGSKEETKENQTCSRTTHLKHSSETTRSHVSVNKAATYDYIELNLMQNGSIPKPHRQTNTRNTKKSQSLIFNHRIKFKASHFNTLS